MKQKTTPDDMNSSGRGKSSSTFGFAVGRDTSFQAEAEPCPSGKGD